jgi:hypothetical protein
MTRRLLLQHTAIIAMNLFDRVLMGALRHGTERMAGSAIMVRGGAIRARLYESDFAVYDAALLEAEYLARVAPQTLSRKVADGYLRGMVEETPGVITLNMRAASACVIEFLARMFPFRQFPNEARARSIFMLAEGDEDTFALVTPNSCRVHVARSCRQRLGSLENKWKFLVAKMLA